MTFFALKELKSQDREYRVAKSHVRGPLKNKIKSKREKTKKIL